MSAKDIELLLKAKATRERAKGAASYFKTGKGEYGEGDIFFGVTVPDQRKIAKEHSQITLPELKLLLQNKVHECRLTALFILRHQYRKADQASRKKIAAFFLKNKKHVNNWDLVDSSAPYILGDFLINGSRSVLYKLAYSKNIWDKRMAIITTSAFIRRNEFDDTLKIAHILLHDPHDLIHKAVGWMLREAGDRSIATLRNFLDKNAATMPRTMLRYAIEKLPPMERKKYLDSKNQKRV